ncbi:MAG: amino acid adenylation domain-containing protein, partial [Candidatus Aminicenantes bacterium]|nr:amino acid adenylation domain-containing protein [Candidatus Aminicenantes bacterium]
MEKLNPKRIENILALTPLQEGILFHYLKNPGSDYYFEQLSLEISGEIDVRQFEKAWNTVIETNEMLRTVFRWEKLEKPSQIILDERHCQVIYYDLSAKDNNRKKTALAEIKNNDRHDTFDLREVPFRIILCKLTETQYQLVVSNHHILYDGWSAGIILKEFFKTYHALCSGTLPLKPPLKTPFKEFLKWIQGQDRNRQEKFWREYLAGFETPTGLPIKKRSGETANAEDYSIILDEDIRSKLDVFVKNNRVTLASVFYTAWGILLQKYCGGEDVVFGTTVSGRSGEIKGIEDMVGLFINTIPLRIQSTPSEKIGALVYRTDEALREREEFENTPLVDIGSFSPVAGTPLFDTIVVIENYPPVGRDVARNVSTTVHSYSMVETTHYDLSVGIVPFNEIEINFNFRRGCFAKETVENLARHLKGIIQAIIENPETVLSQLEIISTEEKKRVLYEFNNTAAEYPADKTIHQLFAEQASRTPDHISLVGATAVETLRATSLPTPPPTHLQITYRQLNKQSDRLAGSLIEKGVLPDNIVGIKTERSIEMVIGIFGILKAGGAYLPIDPHYPQERIDYMLKDSVAKILLTAAECVFNFHHSSFIIHHSNRSTHLAYIIYTSGSTGKPKGVLIEHASVVNRMFWVKERYRLNERDVILQAASFVFDVSVCELFRWIPAGARLCLLPPGGEMDPGLIVKTIARYGAVTADFVPSVLTLILDQVDKHKAYDDLASLKWMFTGVETVSLNLVKRFRETLARFNNTTLINAYGPTESTVDVTYFQCAKNFDTVPIGKPMANVRVYIVDKFGNLQPPGIGGELCIAGKGLARGYLNNPELTCEKFNRSYKTYILYKTGDLCKWLPDGNIEFLGRMDQQVKIRGFRVEPGEIEGRLLSYPGIKEAVVLVQEEEKGDKYLCAYVVSDVENAISELREYLAMELPDYMIPAYFVPLEKIPLTSSGKVDRKALPKPGLKIGESYTAPRNEVEKKLVKLWSEILSRDALHASQLQTSLGIDDNFFHLGGHSLKATQLTARIHRTFNVKISLAELFKAPTIRGIAATISESAETLFSDIKNAEEKDFYELSYNQKRLWFIRQMDPAGSAFNMPGRLILNHHVEDAWIEKTLAQLAHRHESFRTCFKIIRDQPVQRLVKEAPIPLKKIDLSMLASVEKQRKQEEIFNEMAVASFDLTEAPLFRAVLLKLDQQVYEFMFNLHHIITDGWSMEIIKRDFTLLYEGARTGNKVGLESIPIRYTDFVEWYNDRLQDPLHKAVSHSFWKTKLENGIPGFTLPVDFAGGRESREGAGYRCFIEKDITGGIKRLAEHHNTTLFTVMFSVYILLLSRLSGEQDVACSIIGAGREHASLHPIVGFFVNSIIYSARVDLKTPFANLLEGVKADTLELFQHQDYPLELVFEELRMKYPEISVTFNMLNLQESLSAHELETIENGHVKNPVEVKFDLEPYISEYKNGLQIYWSYKKNVFRPGTIAYIAREYIQLMDYFSRNPGGSYIDYRRSNTAAKAVSERKALPLAPGLETLPRAFEGQVKKTPDRIAIIVRDSHFTYGELNRYAGRIAYFIEGKLKRGSERVGLLFEHGYDMIAAIIGTLKAGKIYAPLSASYPVKRLSYMLSDSGASLMLTNTQNMPLAAALAEENHIEVGEVGGLNRNGGAVLLKKTGITGNSPAYILYTSGSTGNPKGVLQTHENVLYFIEQYTNDLAITPNDRMTLFSSFAHDAAVMDIYGALFNGAALYPLNINNDADMASLAGWLKKQGITIWHSVPTVFRYFVNTVNINDLFPRMRLIVLGGEAVRRHDIEMHREFFPHATLCNLYGQTESSY